MIGMDIDKEMMQFLSDVSRKINKDNLISVCKIRQCEKTCRYIMLGPIGSVCVKNTPLKKAIDEMNINKQMKAKGDNCDGLGVCPHDIKEEKSFIKNDQKGNVNQSQS